MRMGDLATTTGVPVATLKYYLREGLLHPGIATAVNQAAYDDGHVRRVKLVQALLQLGRLSIADAQQVIAAVEDEGLPIHDAFGVAQDAMVPDRDRSGPEYAAALDDVDRFVRRHRLRVRPEAAVRRMLADALVGLGECDLLPAGVVASSELFDSMVPALVAMAEQSVASTPDLASRAEQVEHTVAGTIVFEVAYAAVRRLTLEDASARRFTPTRSAGQ
jgi:DNA-binding transcriptional MerR regulator